MKKIAILASGSGTNTEVIINHFTNSAVARVTLILSNNPKAYVLERAKNHQIDSISFNREEFYQTEMVLDVLKEYQIDFVVLAGFMWLVPEYLIRHFERRMVNIHPALLPKYGGKGMYGMHVHQAVKDNNEKETGITIHFVNEEYDKGNIILQAKCVVLPEDTPEDIANKVHQLEYEHYPKVIEELVKSD
jgi:phosphoribosylglycinamide formyltransferase-1